MALDVLLNSLAHDVAGEARQLLDGAAVEAARIRADAAAGVARRATEALAARDAGLRAWMDVERARARREARVAMLRARQGFLDRSFAAVEAELPGALDRPEHADELTRLVGEALDFFPQSPAVIRCRVGLADRLRPMVGSSGAVRLTPDDSVPEGVIVEAEDGSATVNNTLVERLRRLRPQLSIDLLARLESPR